MYPVPSVACVTCLLYSNLLLLQGTKSVNDWSLLCAVLVNCEVLNFALCHEEIYGMLGRTHTLFISRGGGHRFFQKYTAHLQILGTYWGHRNDRRHSPKFSRPAATWVQGFVHPWFILFLRRLSYSGDVTAGRRASQSTHGPCGCLWREVAATSLVVSKTWLTLNT